MSTESRTQGEKTVLLLGATGGLGSLIGRALLAKPGVKLRCLVREGSREKVAELAAQGAEIVIGDVGAGSEAALEKACEGVYSVVSALQGMGDVLIEGQLRVLAAARKAGVRRMIPSDFSFDHFELEEGRNINSDVRRGFAKAAEAARGDVEVSHVLCGCFVDRRVLFGFLGAVDLAAGVVRIWGDGKAPIDFTTYQDTALYTAEAAVDPEPLPRKFNIAGETMDAHGLAKAVSEGVGREIKVERLGSMEDLDAELARRLETEPTNFFAWMPLMYWREMLRGKTKLGALVNGRYPHIRPQTIVEYLKATGGAAS
ncbi:MAG: NmrA family NAD(P)-binding protein [Polyangiaceae bacterium]